MTGADVSRRTLIGDTAIDLLARDGLRGLTHRAVDRAARLPSGSTSYYARTRHALLELTVGRMLERDEGTVDLVAAAPEDLVHAIAIFLRDAMTAGRASTLARYELALEATRRPELRAVYDQAGSRVRRQATELLAAAGSPEPSRHARAVLAWCDGLLFDSIAGAGSARPPSYDELVTDARELLNGLLPHRS